MFYSGINHYLPVIINLSKCLQVHIKTDNRITFCFEESEEFIVFNDNDERHKEFEKIKEYLKHNKGSNE